MRPLRRLPALLCAAALALASCQQHPLRVGTSGDYPPFSLLGADGVWTGFDAEVARAYARDRGRALEIVPFRWPDLEAAMARGAFDVAMSGVTVRADRLVAGRFTAAVARTQAVLVARAAGRTARTVAVNRGGHLERLLRERRPDVTVVTVEDNRTLLDRLRAGEVDAVATDLLEAAPALVRGDATVVGTLAYDRKAYWLSPDAEALQDDLDAWLLARERDGTLPALRARTLGDAQTTAALPPAVGWVVDLLGRRLLLMPAVAAAKRVAGVPLEDPAREAQVVERTPAAVRDLARAEIAAAKQVQAAAGVAPAPPQPLAAYRAGIDRIDRSLATALAAAAPVAVPADVLLERLREDAAVPGAGDDVLRALADALRAVPPP